MRVHMYSRIFSRDYYARASLNNNISIEYVLERAWDANRAIAYFRPPAGDSDVFETGRVGELQVFRGEDDDPSDGGVHGSYRTERFR